MSVDFGPGPWDGVVETAPVELVQAPPRTWQPVDLTAVLEGAWEAPQATVGRRADGVGLLYPRKVHTVASESEAGKTWLALSACIDELYKGEHVLYIDFEDDEGAIVRRLLALQVAPDVIRRQFHYIRPTEALGAGIHADDLRRTLSENRPTVCILDGVTEAMTLHGMDPLSNKDIAAFGRMLPRAISEAGPAVVCLDHVVKSSESRGRYAIGGVHKLNGLDGAAFVLENRKPFGEGLTGITTVRIAKDRPGQLRKHGLPAREGLVWFADLRLTSHAEGFLEVEVVAPEDSSKNEFRPTTVMVRVSEALIEKGPMSARQIEATVTGKSKTIRDAISLLQVENYITEGAKISSLKPFEGGPK